MGRGKEKDMQQRWNQRRWGYVVHCFYPLTYWLLSNTNGLLECVFVLVYRKCAGWYSLTFMLVCGLSAICLTFCSDFTK